MWTTSILLPNFNKSVDYIYRWIFVSRVLVAVGFAECFLVSPSWDFLDKPSASIVRFTWNSIVYARVFRCICPEVLSQYIFYSQSESILLAVRKHSARSQKVFCLQVEKLLCGPISWKRFMGNRKRQVFLYKFPCKFPCNIVQFYMIRPITFMSIKDTLWQPKDNPGCPC